MLNWKSSVLALSLATLVSSPLWAQDKIDDATTTVANTVAEATARDSVAPAVKEAIEALNETAVAVKALADGKNDDAVAALERAIGKLEVVLSTNPDVGLVPVDVTTSVLDVVATPDEIRKARAEAERLLKDHRLQLARPIISQLASEVDVTTTYIPLKTYPLALKSAAALIKDNKTDEATAVLATALGTLVSEQVALPLPILHADALITEAKVLSAKADRSDDENARLAVLLDALDAEIAKGEALEYGGKGAFDDLKAEMKEIRKQTANGGSGEGIFAKLKGLFDGFGK